MVSMKETLYDEDGDVASEEEVYELFQRVVETNGEFLWPKQTREDGKRLASLYSDMAVLIQLDGDDQVVSNTEEIKETNALAGKMLKLNLKDKYPNLALECSNYVMKMIGNDNITLDSELRTKAVQAFRSLAWACNEGSK